MTQPANQGPERDHRQAQPYQRHDEAPDGHAAIVRVVSPHHDEHASLPYLPQKQNKGRTRPYGSFRRPIAPVSPQRLTSQSQSPCSLSHSHLISSSFPSQSPRIPLLSMAIMFNPRWVYHRKRGKGTEWQLPRRGQAREETCVVASFL